MAGDPSPTSVSRVSRSPRRQGLLCAHSPCMNTPLIYILLNVLQRLFWRICGWRRLPIRIRAALSNLPSMASLANMMDIDEPPPPPLPRRPPPAKRAAGSCSHGWKSTGPKKSRMWPTRTRSAPAAHFNPNRQMPHLLFHDHQARARHRRSWPSAGSSTAPSSKTACLS